MKIRVQSIHFDADKKLLQFIEEKVDKLVHFYDHIIGGEVTLKVDKASDNKNKIVQIKFPKTKINLKEDISQLKLMVVVHLVGNNQVLSIGPVWNNQESR